MCTDKSAENRRRVQEERIAKSKSSLNFSLDSLDAFEPPHVMKALDGLVELSACLPVKQLSFLYEAAITLKPEAALYSVQRHL